MRYLLLFLGAAAIVSCDRPESGESTSQAPVVPAVITYDGSNSARQPDRVQHGKRLSYVLGCTGCHGDKLQGQNVTEKAPNMGDWWAPNVTLHMAKYSDAQLERLIRHGEPKDGRTFYFMPAESLQYTSDADLAALVTYLRTLEPAGDQTPSVRKGPLFVELEKKGEFAPAPQMIRRFQAEQPADLGERHRQGRYIAMTVCTECHNSKLQGFEGFSPDLDIAGAYEADELARLLTTGEGKVDKDLGLMSATARHRFSKFTQRERSAIVGYLIARAKAAK
jgi:mono/diheme cytochrome c family protein